MTSRTKDFGKGANGIAYKHKTTARMSSDGRFRSWRGIRDGYLTWLHSGEPEVEAFLEGLEALTLIG
jgi:hypothetical protein